jgi:hypothetical protein
MKLLVLTMPAQAPHDGSSVYYGYFQSDKSRADGEPASVTDEKPAHDSAGHCGPVD